MPGRRREMAAFVAAGSPLRHERLVHAFDALGDTPGYEVFVLGQLRLPSGQVVVCDPSEAAAAGVAEPFDETFPHGEFTVRGLAVREGRDQRVGALEVRFQVGSVRGLEPAFTPSWRARVARKPGVPWTSVDSASIGLGSAEAFDLFVGRETDDDELLGVIAPGPADGSNPYLSVRAADLFTETDFDGANLFVVLAGRGDGSAQCILEQGADGQALRLLVDFGLLGSAQPITRD